MINESQIKKLYRNIHECHICPNMDKYKALRRHEAIDNKIDTFIISQSLAEGQLRLSGVNFFMPNGQLGSTGKNLEKFLNQFRRTLYPPIAIQLSLDTIIPKARQPYISVYNTELTQCFPGKKIDGNDRPPHESEVQRCLSQHFLDREIALIKPRLLLLMGDRSRRAFYKYVMKQPRSDNLGDHISSIIHKGNIPILKIYGEHIFVLPIQHASGANPGFNQMSQDQTLTQLITKILQ